MTSTAGQQVLMLTREQLYERVWSEPMATLAPQFGISDVALKKTCARMRIPTPYRDYWAKRGAGQPARRTPLPKLPSSAGRSITSVEFGRPPKPAASEQEPAVGPIADQERYEADPAHRVTVPEVLTDPHPLVAASVRALRKAKPDHQHRLVPRDSKCLAVSVTLGSVDRAMCILDGLLKALEHRGYSVQILEDQQGMKTSVSLLGEQVAIAIEERVDHVEKKPDPRDVARGYSLYGKQYDHVPSGKLTLRIAHEYLSVRRSWADGAKQRVEQCLNAFVVGLAAAAEALRKQRLEREARERERNAAEERRRLAEQRRQEEAARVRALDADLRAYRKSLVVRDYVQAMRASAQAAGQLDADSDMTHWLAWAEEYADSIDPTRGTPEVPDDPDPPRWPGYQHVGAGGSTGPGGNW